MFLSVQEKNHLSISPSAAKRIPQKTDHQYVVPLLVVEHYKVYVLIVPGIAHFPDKEIILLKTNKVVISAEQIII